MAPEPLNGNLATYKEKGRTKPPCKYRESGRAPRVGALSMRRMVNEPLQPKGSPASVKLTGLAACGVMKFKLRFLHALPYGAEGFSLLFVFNREEAHARAELLSHFGDASAAR